MASSRWTHVDATAPLKVEIVSPTAEGAAGQ